MVHMIARNTTGEQRNADVAAALADAQAHSALQDHTRLANDVVRRVTARRRLPATLGAAVAKSVSMMFANEAALMLRAPSSVPDRGHREALLRGLEAEADNLERFSKAIVAMLGIVLDAIDLPPEGAWATLTLEVPSITRMSAPATTLTTAIEATLQFAPDTAAVEPLFAVGFALAGDMMKKLLRASNMSETEARDRPHRLKWPAGSDTPKLMEYVAGTAFEPIFTAAVTLQVTDAHLFEHMTIIGGAGAGKSQTIEAIIARHLERPDSDRMGMVVIDSQGDLLQHIMRHRACKDRLIYVDPTDVSHSPALNLFDLGLKRSEGADARLREAIRNSVLELYELTLGDLLLSDLTAKMRVPFRFLCALMLEIPGATLQDLRAVLRDLTPYRDAVAKLPSTAQRFFESDFEDKKAFGDTRQQIGWRIDGLLVNSAFERMFAARASKLDLFTALNDGKIVLVNTAKEHLRDEASSIFGKYMIAATLAAILDRARIPEHKRTPATLVIDEAHEYLSSDVEMLLRQARKYRCAVLLASQTIADMKPAFRDSLMANTAIKLAASISDRGAETLAANMKTTSGFIHGQTKTATHARFATHVRNLTREAVTLQVPFGALDRAPKLTAAELATLLEANRVALSAPPDDRPRHDQPRHDQPSHDKPRPDVPDRDKPRGKTGSGTDAFWETY